MKEKNDDYYFTIGCIIVFGIILFLIKVYEKRSN